MEQKQDLLLVKNNAITCIYLIRNTEVMLDFDVSKMYGVDSIAELNRKVKLNPKKFDSNLYCFDLTDEEKKQVILMNEGKNNNLKYSKNIKAYTEYGILMLATTFSKNNDFAIEVCKILVETFVEYKKQKLSKNDEGGLVTDDKPFSKLKRDVEILKQLALDQKNQNELYDAHFKMIFEMISDDTEEKTEDKQIGFKIE